MTTVFVRHVMDGGQCVANVRRLFNGLDGAMYSLGDDVVCRLGGWVRLIGYICNKTQAVHYIFSSSNP